MSASPNAPIAPDLEAKKRKGDSFADHGGGRPRLRKYGKGRAHMDDELVTVDHPFCPQPHANIDPGGSAQFISIGPCVLYTGNKDSKIVYRNVATARDKDICEDYCGRDAGLSGPPIVGLTNPTTPATTYKQNLSPFNNKGATPSTLKVYSKSKWRKKQQQHLNLNDNSEISNQNHNILGLENFSIKGDEKPNNKITTSPGESQKDL